MDFLDRVIDYIEANVSLYAPMRVGILSDDDSIAIRPTPSTPPEGYLIGDRARNFPFQVLTQHSQANISYQTLEAITEALDGLRNEAITSSDGSFVFVKCEVYTGPNFVEVTSRGKHIYTAIFQAELLIEKEV